MTALSALLLCSRASLWTWRRQDENTTQLQATCPYLSLVSGAKIHQFSWSCPLPWRHLPGRSQWSLLQGGEDSQLPQPTGQKPFGSPPRPQLHVADLLHLRPLPRESSPQEAGRRGRVGGNPHSLVPQVHCKGNKKLISFPVLGQQRHRPLPTQGSLNTEERKVPLELVGKE